MGTLSQQGRLLEFTGPKGTEDCVLTEFTGTEGLSKDFEFELNLLSDQSDLTAKQLIGKAATIKLSHSSSETRIFNGIICSFDAGNIDYQGHRTYKLEIWPWLASLQHHQDCRIFQRQTVPQIFTTICKDIGFYDYDVSKLGLNYKPLNYCVQYNETSYDFLHRILAEAGIYYLYMHTEDKHKLTLLDSKSSIKQYNKPIEQSNIHHSREHIHKWEPQQRKTPDTISARDYCFTDPGLNLQTSGKVGPPGWIPEALEKFLYPGGYTDNDQGDKKVNRHVQVENWQSKTISGASNVVNLLPGMKFKITNDNSYRVIEITHKSQTTKDAQTYQNELTSIPQGVTYSPPSHTKPKIRSQTAIVVGPKDQKTYTDKYGRVKVQFHWDRYGQQDENSSCWLRVAQPCAGPNWGAQFIPRPGSEVLVSFINGDPDRPIITGSYYNEANQLLSDNPAVSGIKTRITDDNKCGHHLLFDDTPGAEKFMLHSEGKLTIDTQNNATHTVSGNEAITIKGAHTTQVKQGKLNINAGTLTLKVGGSQVVLDQSGIKIKPAGKLHLLATGAGDTKPVARVGDDHKCPKMIKGTPHKGGPILKGSPVSTANGMAIAREGDKMHCISDSDTIKKGIPSILVDGKPIAKVNSKATHGGIIIAGSPNVHVGESKGTIINISNESYNYYIVTYEGFKQLLADGLLESMKDALVDFNLADGFEESRWQQSPETVGDVAKKKTKQAKESYNYQQVQEKNRDAWKGKYKPIQLSETEEEPVTQMNKSSMIKGAAIGTAVSISNFAYKESLKHQLIENLKKITAKIKAMMPQTGGVLIEAEYQTPIATDTGPTIRLMHVYPIGPAKDYKPLIKKTMTGPFYIDTPSAGYRWEFLFIWAVKKI